VSAQPAVALRSTGTVRTSPSRAALLELFVLSTVVAGCLPLLWPLMQPGMPATHDGFLHVQRLIALDAAARDGALLTRWLPDLAYGYGQPLLLYYAPLSYVPALALRLLGLGYVASFELTSGLALVLSALSMYVLARALFGSVASAAAALVYAALPYQLVDLYVRGALAESWAFVWLPFAVRCLISIPTAAGLRWTTGAALAIGGLVLTHNVTALLTLPALGLLVALLRIAPGRRAWRIVVASGAALALGVGLAAWFWVPAIAERHLVQIDQTIEPKLFASFFLTGWPPFRPDPIFSYEQPVSDALGYPIFWPQLGLVQALVSMLGAMAVLRLRGTARAVGSWALLLVAGGWLLQTRPFAVLYDLVPLLLFVQFPWRLLTIVGLGSALLAAVLVDGFAARQSFRVVLASTVVGASLLTALPGLDPEQTPVDDRFLSTETVLRSELAEWGLGGTHSGEYLPVSSGQRNATRLRKSMLDAGGSRSAEPVPLSVGHLDWQPDRVWAEVTNEGPAAERLLISQFSFDGWNATVDGLTVRMEAAGELGLAAVRLPPGRHTVEFAWTGTGTAARQLGVTLSVLSVVALVLLAFGRHALGHRGRRWGSATLILLALLAVNTHWWIRSISPVVAQSTPSVRWQPVDETLALVDARTDSSRLVSDGVVLTHLHWLVLGTPPIGYRAAVEATAADGSVHRAPWVYEPLSRLWEPGQLARTVVAVRVPGSVPLGRLDLALVFDQPAGLAPIPLGSLSLPASAPGDRPRLDGGDKETEIGAIRLTLPAQDRWTVRSGASRDLPLLWRTDISAPDRQRELLVRAVLTVAGGRTVAVSEVRRPGDWFAPLPFWQASETIPQRIRLRPPNTVVPGEYPLALEIYTRDLARGGASETGASTASVRGRPLRVVPLGTLVLVP
jgi:hypothetical protein